MTKNRQFLKNDPATIGQGPAMCSASQRPIQVDDVLYETELAESQYSSRHDDDRYKLVITAHRVIQVNYQYRAVRIRCVNGCERSLAYDGNSCPKTKYWHTLSEAKKELSDKLEKWIKDNERGFAKEEAKFKAKAKHFQELKKQLPTYNVVKIPVALPTPL